MRNMHKICKGRTVIIIAHRLSTVKNADRIIVMEKGKLLNRVNIRNCFLNRKVYTVTYISYSQTNRKNRRI